MSEPIVMPSNHTLTGAGPARTRLVADTSRWIFTGGDSVVASVDSVGVVVSDFTIDASGVATYAVAARGMTVTGMELTNGRCSAVGIAGYQMVIQGNSMTNNAVGREVPGRGYLNCASGGGGGVAEGAAIYAEGVAAEYAPLIEGNHITGTYGPALDVNGVWGGIFRNNVVHDNAAWAGVSLYGASHWQLIGNTVSHPADQPGQPYHRYCRGGPNGAHAAAIFICQDTDAGNLVSVGNLVQGNRASSYYGILSVGAKELAPYLVPRLNQYFNNDVRGSVVGCADNFAPSQWLSDTDSWRGNTCAGVADSPPAYF